MSGYVRLHRCLIGHPAFRNDAEAMAFAWLVVRAAWKPCRVRYKGRPVSLDRGQLAISIRDFATAMDRDKAWVERLFKRLRAETMIETANETGLSVITICNYSRYQAVSEGSETADETREEADARQAQDTEQGSEEGKKEEDVSNETSVPKPVEMNGVEEGLALKPDHLSEAWNKIAASRGAIECRRMGAERRRRAIPFLRRYPIEDITEAITAVGRSDFLCGRGKDKFRADIDFLFSPNHMNRLLEGFYDR